MLLWGGLNEHGFGPEAIESVARGDLAALPRLLAALGPTSEGEGPARVPRLAARVASPALRLAYPLLLMTGVRRPHRSDLAAPRPAPTPPTVDTGFEGRAAALPSPNSHRPMRMHPGPRSCSGGRSAISRSPRWQSLSLAGLALPPG